MAQTSQFFDAYHRPGNVHDPTGAEQFMMKYFGKAKEELKDTLFESRIDSAFFNDTILSVFDGNHVKFSASVPSQGSHSLKRCSRRENDGEPLTGSGHILRRNGNQSHGIRPTDSFSHVRKQESV